MEPVFLVAPVTALEFLGDSWLLAGEGPTLTAYSLQTSPPASATLGVLRNHRIHGIRPQATHQHHTGCEGHISTEELQPPSDLQGMQLAVFGGKAVRLVKLRAGEIPGLGPLGPLMELQDWVLDARWLDCGAELLAVALAHNATLLLQPREGCTLKFCSCKEVCLLYSALLVGSSWSSFAMVGGTVFNQLVIWRPGEGRVKSEGGEGNAGEMMPVERRLLGHSGVIFSLAYLPEHGQLVSASDDRSVRVWGVGALAGAAGCGLPSPLCLQVLYGHQARVFSVRLSPVGVFSAGEDGVCLTWDWISGRVMRTLKGHRVGGIRALAVGTGTTRGRRLVATGGADGGIRLWDLGEDDRPPEGAGKLCDLGFNGRGCPKVVRVVDDGAWGQRSMLVSTDLGDVYLWELQRGWTELWQGGLEFCSYNVMELLSWGQGRGLCALGSLTGKVWVFLLSQPRAGVELRTGTGKIHSLLWVHPPGEGNKGILLVSGAEGMVHRWQVETQFGDVGGFLSAVPLTPFILPPCAKRWLTAVVFLPQADGALWVCGDRRGSLLLYCDKGAGAEGNAEGLQPSSILFGVHGKQGVTSVCEHDGLHYSTGRDGCVRVSRVDAGLLTVLRVQRACRTMDWVERVLVLDPRKNPEEGTDGGQVAKKARFLILGFHSIHFVVWDLVRQEQLLSVPCGGGHRSWSYWPPQGPGDSGMGLVVFVKQGAVLASHVPEDTLAGGSHQELKEGFHGRGINCICHLGSVCVAGRSWEALATGGEDTTVTVLAVETQSGRYRVLAIITDHISSVRTLASVQRLHTAEEGGSKAALSSLLFSAGGRAQLQCCQVLIGEDEQLGLPSCQVIQVASHRLDEHWERRRNRHKTVKMDPETRYVSIAVLSSGPEDVVLALSCSDGALRLFSVSESRGSCQLLWESYYHQRCVLSIATCCLEDPHGNSKVFVFSAATDGRIAVWDMTAVRNATSCWDGPHEPCLSVAAHQSGVNTLAVWEGIGGGQGSVWEGQRSMTVASGGDDGQLSVVCLNVQFHPKTAEGSDVSLQMLTRCAVPLAHSSPLTALRPLSSRLLITASPDQRVCMWNLSDSTLCHQGVLFSHVADAAGLVVWKSREGEGSTWAVVCGQGLQLLRVAEEADSRNSFTRTVQEKALKELNAL